MNLRIKKSLTYEQAVERMARAMVKRRDPEITAKMTPEMAARLFAITALASIGIAAPKGRARK